MYSLRTVDFLLHLKPEFFLCIIGIVYYITVSTSIISPVLEQFLEEVL